MLTRDCADHCYTMRIHYKRPRLPDLSAGDDSAVDPEHTIRGVRIATGPTMSGPFTNA